MTLLLILYQLNLIFFAFIKNVVGYCLLLICNSLYIITIIYYSSNFSWYALLVYLVYVGGVYILFIFLSVHLPNISNFGYVNITLLFFSFFFSWEMFNGILGINNSLFEYSFNFCSLGEGYMYLFLCGFLLICFFLVSLINSSKESFLR